MTRSFNGRLLIVLLGLAYLIALVVVPSLVAHWDWDKENPGPAFWITVLGVVAPFVLFGLYAAIRAAIEWVWKG
jgi:Na+/serine symporter